VLSVPVDYSSRGFIQDMARRFVKSRKLSNQEALAHWELSRQKHTRVVILNNVTLLLLEILPLATAKLI